jgi:hypothetical protein
MAEIIKCSNEKCNKVIGEGKATVKKVYEGKQPAIGNIIIKCKCGTFNEIDSSVKPYVQNQPYQNRMQLVKK